MEWLVGRSLDGKSCIYAELTETSFRAEILRTWDNPYARFTLALYRHGMEIHRESHAKLRDAQSMAIQASTAHPYLDAFGEERFYWNTPKNPLS